MEDNRGTRLMVGAVSEYRVRSCVEAIGAHFDRHRLAVPSLVVAPVHRCKAHLLMGLSPARSVPAEQFNHTQTADFLAFRRSESATQVQRIYTDPAHSASGLNAYFARDPSLRTRFDHLRRYAGGIVGSNYDVSDSCNLRCEGCLYFAGDDRDGHGDSRTDEAWADLFAAERRRGVNFAYLAGGEPALAPRRLALAAEHIGRGVIFTNGTVRIDERLPFVRHVSIWGDRDESATLRGGDSFEKAFRLHGGSAHSRFIMTVNALNLESAWRVAERCQAAGSPLSFSIFSPTTQYRERLAAGCSGGEDFFRLSTPDAHLIPGPDMLIRIRDTLDAVAAQYPQTVIYAPAYGRWVTRPEGLYEIDPVTGWATDCGTRRTGRHRHYRTDLSSSTSKCCSPNIDCLGCRAYSMASGTAVSRFRRFASTYQGFRDWLDISEQWAALFLARPA